MDQSINQSGANGKSNIQLPHPITPSSDGAGTILATGSAIPESTFRAGDKVVTHLTAHTDPTAPTTFQDINAGLCQTVHGTLRKYAVFHSSSLVKMPQTLAFQEAATLTCSRLTAWNALFGLRGRGGVSVAALQSDANHRTDWFALTSGATVLATTSSSTKASKLTALGAHTVINYKETPDWGEVAKSYTPDSRGFDAIVDVGGPSTVAQSLKAIRPDGLIALAGLLGAGEDEGRVVPSIMDGLTYLCMTRGFLLGSRVQFAEMNRFIDEKGVKPVVDERALGFGEVKEAYQYLERQRHFSKVVIDIE
ncbi:hypothetical protein BJX70DRAFT_411148 [Aspergillus crustosus]